MARLPQMRDSGSGNALVLSTEAPGRPGCTAQADLAQVSGRCMGSAVGLTPTLPCHLQLLGLHPGETFQPGCPEQE